MNATNELRYLASHTTEPVPAGTVLVDNVGNILTTQTITRMVLQQKWVKQVFNEYGVAHDTDQFEWRDVPTVGEQA